MRADCEIDRGWYFMGAKRRENYDDWWRSEINFEPVLDELFGITHGKQGISPRPEMLAALEIDLEPIARALNNRVRQGFELAKATKPLGDAERQAARADVSLPPFATQNRSVVGERSSATHEARSVARSCSESLSDRRRDARSPILHRDLQSKSAPLAVSLTASVSVSRLDGSVLSSEGCGGAERVGVGTGAGVGGGRDFAAGDRLPAGDQPADGRSAFGEG
jgi:hypothetical protein